MDWFCISPFPFPRHRRNLSCISIVSYPLGKEEVGGGHIPCLKAVPGVAALRAGEEGVERAQFLMASTQSISDSATHPLHPHLTVTAEQIAPRCPALLAADLLPPHSSSSLV